MMEKLNIDPIVPPMLVWNSQIEQQQHEQDDPPKEEPKDDPSDDDAELGTGGKAALAKEREARVKAERELKKFRDEEEKRKKAEMSETDRLKTDITDLGGKLTSAEARALRFEIALDLGIPKAMATRIQGDDEAAMRADATELKKLVVPEGKKPPKADPSQGRKSDNSGLTPKEEFTDLMDGLFDKETS